MQQTIHRAISPIPNRKPMVKSIVQAGRNESMRPGPSSTKGLISVLFLTCFLFAVPSEFLFLRDCYFTEKHNIKTLNC